MLLLIALFLVFSYNGASSDVIDLVRSTQPCDVGDTIQNGRVTCTCSQEYVYQCWNTKTSQHRVDDRHGDKSTTKNLTCQPNKVYIHDSTTCICDHKGSWPHGACGDIFDSLPSNTVVKNSCQPDGYVIVGCNVCRCDPEGNIDTERCTKNECDSKTSRRKSGKANSVYGNCEARNWYSLAPCQFCFCINENKLVCNTGNYVNKKLQLGTYNLSVCGKELIREAIELIPDADRTLRQGNLYTTSKPQTETTENNDLFHEKDEPPTEETAAQDSTETKKEDKDSETDSESEEAKVPEGTPRTIVSTQQIPYHEDYQLYSKESKESEKEGNSDNEVVNAGLKIPVRPLKSAKTEEGSSLTQGNNNEAALSGLGKTHQGFPASGYGRNPEDISKFGTNSLKFEESILSGLGNGAAKYDSFPRETDSYGYGGNVAAPISGYGNIPMLETDNNPDQASEMDAFMELGRQFKERLPQVLSKVFSMALRRKSMVTIDKSTPCTPGDINVVKCNTCFCLKNSKLLCTNNKCE